MRHCWPFWSPSPLYQHMFCSFLFYFIYKWNFINSISVQNLLFVIQLSINDLNALLHKPSLYQKPPKTNLPLKWKCWQVLNESCIIIHFDSLLSLRYTWVICHFVSHPCFCFLSRHLYINLHALYMICQHTLMCLCQDLTFWVY